MKLLRMSVHFIVLGVGFFSTFSILYAFDRTQCEKKTFIVTAYYSPLDDQAFYYKPTVKEEKILNGQGVQGASGRKVFNGMIAAPTGYPFGDHIYFPDLGIGEVTDRGGAIVHSGERGFEHDRIDIWMGHGEEGLIKALTFGRQTLQAYHCPKQTSGLKNTKKGFYLDSIPIYENFFDVALWIQELKPGRSDIWAYTLQKYLISLGYLNIKNPTGNFGTQTKNALCSYQVKRGLYKKDNPSCGFFDRRTRVVMKTDVTKKNLLPSTIRKKDSVGNIVAHARTIQNTITPTTDTQSQDTAQVAKQLLQSYFTKTYQRNESDEKIKVLQLLLQRLQLYQGFIDGIYSYETLSAVYKFQSRFGLVNTRTPQAALGHLGPATRQLLNEKLAETDILSKPLSEQIEQTHSVATNTTTTNAKPSNSPTPSSGPSSAKPDTPKPSTENIKYIITTIPSSFSFYRAYTLREQNKEIRYLQDFLRAYTVYTGESHGVYTRETIDALFAFQRQEKLLTEDASITVRGFLGPQTRQHINQLLGHK